MPTVEQDDKATLALPYGKQLSQGRVVYYEKQGSQTAFIVLFGKKGQDGIDRARYAGQDLLEFDSAGNRQWKFHSGEGSTDNPDAFFSHINWNGAGRSFAEVKLPAQFSDEEEPTRAQFWLRCLKTKDYDNTGAALTGGATSFTRSNARIVADLWVEQAAAYWARRGVDPKQLLEWASWVEFRQECDAGIGWATGSGIKGEYFNDLALTDLKLTRTDALIDFDWTGTSPANEIEPTDYSVRWTGKFKAGYTGNHTFYTYTDDGARLWVNGVQLVNDWTNGPARENSATIALTAGQEYDLVMEYYQNVGPGVVRLSYSTPATAKTVVPQSMLVAGQRQITRFTGDAVFTSRTPLEDAVRQVMMKCPSVTMQLVNGKWRFLPKADRPVVHRQTFDLSQTVKRPNIVDGSFQAFKRDPEEKPRELIVVYRDEEDLYFKERRVRIVRPNYVGEPVEINIGVASQSLASRIGESFMRRIDLDLFYRVTAFPDSYKAAKGDVQEVSNSVYGWTEAAPTKFIALEEKLKANDLHEFFFQIYSNQFYSDTDHGQIQVAPVSDIKSPFVAPPAVTGLTAVERVKTLPDGTKVTTAQALAQFAAHGYPQRGRVWWRDAANERAATANAAADTITSNAHGYTNGTPVEFRNSGGALPAPLSAAATYFVRDATANTFKLAASAGGAAIDLTGAGSGTHYVADFKATEITLFPDRSTLQAPFELSPLVAGEHRLKIVTESEAGVSLALTSHTTFLVNIVGDQTAPAEVTAVTSTILPGAEIEFSFTPPADKDLRRISVWQGAVFKGYVEGNRFRMPITTQVTTVTFKTEDFTGNVSAGVTYSRDIRKKADGTTGYFASNSYSEFDEGRGYTSYGLSASDGLVGDYYPPNLASDLNNSIGWLLHRYRIGTNWFEKKIRRGDKWSWERTPADQDWRVDERQIKYYDVLGVEIVPNGLDGPPAFGPDDPVVAAPTLTKDTANSRPGTLIVHVSTTLKEVQVYQTFVQTRLPGASWPSEAQGTHGTTVYKGLCAEVIVPGAPGVATEIRVGFQTSPGTAVNWSATLTHTFPKWEQYHQQTARARARRTSDVSVGDGVWTAIDFDAEDYDEALLHDTAANTRRFTPRAARWHRLSCVADFGLGVGTVAVRLRYRDNGVDTTLQEWGPLSVPASSAGSTRFRTPTFVYDHKTKLVGDYYWWEVKHTAGLDSNALAGSWGEIRELPDSARVSSLLSGLIASWRLDDAANGTRLDSVGSNHLADNNGVGQAAGKIGNAAAFVRTGQDYLSIADNADLSTGDIDFSFDGWVYLASKGGGSNHQDIIGKWGASGQFEYILLYHATNDRFEFYVSSNGTTITNVSSVTAPPPGTWAYVYCWHDSVNNVIGIKVNDAPAVTVPWSAGVFNGTSAFVIGARADAAVSQYLDGRADAWDFRKRLLTTAEQAERYNNGAGREHPYDQDDVVADPYRYDPASVTGTILVNTDLRVNKSLAGAFSHDSGVPTVNGVASGVAKSWKHIIYNSGQDVQFGIHTSKTFPGMGSNARAIRYGLFFWQNSLRLDAMENGNIVGPLVSQYDVAGTELEIEVSAAGVVKAYKTPPGGSRTFLYQFSGTVSSTMYGWIFPVHQTSGLNIYNRITVT